LTTSKTGVEEVEKGAHEDLEGATLGAEKETDTIKREIINQEEGPIQGDDGIQVLVPNTATEENEGDDTEAEGVASRPPEKAPYTDLEALTREIG
jgi:hypothetical protein